MLKLYIFPSCNFFLRTFFLHNSKEKERSTLPASGNFTYPNTYTVLAQKQNYNHRLFLAQQLEPGHTASSWWWFHALVLSPFSEIPCLKLAQKQFLPARALRYCQLIWLALWHLQTREKLQDQILLTRPGTRKKKKN